MRRNRFWSRSSFAAVALFAACAAGAAWYGLHQSASSRRAAALEGSGAAPFLKPMSYQQERQPTLEGGTGWINSGPIHLEELRGKIVLLDFWTFCCINCHHILPDLARLEEKYKNELVVIGVHYPKFDAERDTENVRRKVREYRIKHPIVCDANQTLWGWYGVQSWPTLVLIDARGQYMGSIAGEGHYAVLDRAIGQLVEKHSARGELNLTPLKFKAEVERPSEGPLLFPGKICADAQGGRLFITDTGHNRIVQTNLEGSQAVAIGDGVEGFQNGGYDQARFNRPQGLFVDGETLYVADTENHAIRAVDLKAHTVSTIAGVGKQGPPRQAPFSGPAKKTALSSPWDVGRVSPENALYIAMAGTHQIWKLDLKKHIVGVFAGSAYENIEDGPAAEAKFAQPSGLATDGKNLFVADSEVSGVRMIADLGGKPQVQTIVGMGLFEFGDIDGQGEDVRLQHCLGVAYGDGRLFIADSYNNRIKECDPAQRTVKTFAGTGEAGTTDDPARFYEPGGLSVAGGQLYVADTNNHKIRVVDLKTRAVKTLALDGLAAPRPAKRPPSFARAKVIKAPAAQVPAGGSIKLAVSAPVPKGFKFNDGTPMVYLVETPGKTDALAASLPAEGQKVDPQTDQLQIDVPLAQPAKAGDSLDLRLSLQTFVCGEKSSLCQIRSYQWNVPITFAAEATGQPVKLSTETGGH